MRLPQVHQTTVLNPDDKEMYYQFLVVPERSARHADKHVSLALLQEIQLTKVSHIEPSLLPFLIAAMLTPPGPQDVLSKARRLSCEWPKEHPSLTDIETSALKFAQQVAFRKLVPFENSPLTQESLADIAAAASVNGENADVLLMQSEGTHLIVVISPKGVVISGPKTSIFDANIWEKVLEWLKG